jgi:hypothetical protein
MVGAAAISREGHFQPLDPTHCILTVSELGRYYAATFRHHALAK